MEVDSNMSKHAGLPQYNIQSVLELKSHGSGEIAIERTPLLQYFVAKIEQSREVERLLSVQGPMDQPLSFRKLRLSSIDALSRKYLNAQATELDLHDPSLS
jgi:hypothetical protein